MKDLYVVRHGQAAPGPSGMDHDFHLTDLGREQAHAAGQELAGCVAKIDAIYCSRLTRARETAEILAQYTPAPLHICDELIEHGSGLFLLDCSLRQVAESHRDCIDGTGAVIYRPGEGPGLNPQFSAGGETLRDLHERARGAYQAILANHPGSEDQCIIVAHGSFISALVSEALGIPIRTIWSVQIANAGCLHLRIHRCEATGKPVAALVVAGPSRGESFARAERIQLEAQ